MRENARQNWDQPAVGILRIELPLSCQTPEKPDPKQQYKGGGGPSWPSPLLPHRILSFGRRRNQGNRTFGHAARANSSTTERGIPNTTRTLPVSQSSMQERLQT